MKKKYVVAVFLSLAFNSSFANDGNPKNFKPIPLGLTYSKTETTLNGKTTSYEHTLCITEEMVKEVLASAPTGCKTIFFKDTASVSDAEVTCPGIEKSRITQRLIDKTTMETVSKSNVFSMKTISKYLGKCSKGKK